MQSGIHIPGFGLDKITHLLIQSFFSGLCQNRWRKKAPMAESATCAFYPDFFYLPGYQTGTSHKAAATLLSVLLAIRPPPALQIFLQRLYTHTTNSQRSFAPSSEISPLFNKDKKNLRVKSAVRGIRYHLTGCDGRKRARARTRFLNPRSFHPFGDSRCVTEPGHAHAVV